MDNSNWLDDLSLYEEFSIEYVGETNETPMSAIISDNIPEAKHNITLDTVLTSASGYSNGFNMNQIGLGNTKNQSNNGFRRPRFDRGFMNGFGRPLSDEPIIHSNNGLQHAGLRVHFNFKCYPLIVYEPRSEKERQDVKLMECSNKIIAPNSIIQKLCQYGNIKSEHVYQINNGKNRVTIGIYYNYDPDSEMAIYVPQYIFEGLGIDYGDNVSFNFINEDIPKGTFVKLQPLTNKILEVEDYETFLQSHLQSNYTCLIKGESIRFPYFDDVIIMLIHELKSDNDFKEIVSITDTDLSVDFEPSVEQREIEAKLEAEMEAKKKEDEMRNKNLVSFGKNMHKINFDAKTQDNEGNVSHAKLIFNRPGEQRSVQEEKPGFVPFQGTGNTLSSSDTFKWDNYPDGKMNISTKEQQLSSESHKPTREEMLAKRAQFLERFQSKPVESKPVESKPVESRPVESKPVESKPVESKPVESKPIKSKPIKSKPVKTSIRKKKLVLKNTSKINKIKDKKEDKNKKEEKKGNKVSVLYDEESNDNFYDIEMDLT